MNCQEFTALLDDGDIRNLPSAKQRALQQHLEGCAQCDAEWRVQERIAMAPAMRVPSGFVAQCRRLVAAGATNVVRRRVIAYSALLVMTAAAAFLVWEQRKPAASSSVVAAAPVSVPASRITAQVESAGEPELSPATARPEDVAIPRDRYTVGVRPMVFEGNDPVGNALAGQFRERIVSMLSTVPNLTVVDMAAASPEVTADYELRLTYRGLVTDPVVRMVSVETRRSVEFAAIEAAIAAEARMSPEDQQRSRNARRAADMQRRSSVMRGGNAGLTLLLGFGAPTMAVISDPPGVTGRVEVSAQQLVRQLQVNVLPLDETFEQGELAILRDPSQRHPLRTRALSALLLYAERRGGFWQVAPAVVRAGAELAFVAENTLIGQRAAIWDALALTRSPELVPYLSRGLDEIESTETRLQLVKILAESFRDDPRARATLAHTAKTNDQQTVRMAAMRESSGPQWDAHVVASLLNVDLSDLQRLQAIANMAPGPTGTLGTSPKTSIVLEEQELRVLGALIVKVAPDHTATEIARKALFAAGAMDTPAALDMLMHVLESARKDDFPPGTQQASVMGVRSTARSLIAYRYASIPRARALIEQLANSADGMERLESGLLLPIMQQKARTQDQLGSHQSER